MTNVVKKVLRKIRGGHLPIVVLPEMTEEQKRASENYIDEFWERDKKIVREANFQKAKIKLEEYRTQQRLEKERQAQIAEQRLKNLKKARRALRKKKDD